VALAGCDWLNVGRPYPVVITSPRESSYGHEYTVTWEKPVDGGLPINFYDIKYRQVWSFVSMCEFNELVFSQSQTMVAFLFKS